MVKKCKITCPCSKQVYFFTQSSTDPLPKTELGSISPALSTHTVPISKTARLLLGLVHPTGSVHAWQYTEVAPCTHTGLKQEVTQLLSCTHLVICLLQQHGAVFSCLPAKSIFCSHSWEPYRWYRSLLPGVQSAFLLGCTLCL